MRFIFYTRLFLFFFLLSCISCKHKQKEQTVIKKEAVKKQAGKPAPVATVGGAGNECAIVFQQKMGLSNKEIKNNRLYAFINEWYSVPYKYAGCQKTGIDCSCFINILYEKVYNKKISRTTTDMYKACEKLSLGDAKEGDLVFFKMYGNGITHVGLFLKNSFFVHSSTSKGVIINSIDEAYYKKYFFCAGKFKNA